MDNNTLIASWNSWVANAPSDEWQGRQQAESILVGYLNNPDGKLNLDGLGLTSLPDPFPDSVKSLSVNDNHLTALPETLPDGIKEIEANNNLLTALPKHLPGSLVSLGCDHNQLEGLPDNLPDGLLRLAVTNNKLTTLPEHLPDNLKDLNVRDNMLTLLPGYEDGFFSGLRMLNLSGNRLTSLPDNFILVKGKASVYLDNNPLLDSVIITLRQANYVSTNRSEFELPQTTTEKILYAEWGKWVNSAPTPNERMSRLAAVKKMTSCLENGLTSLDLSSGNLTSLPDSFPSQLKQLDISHNYLETLPENLPGRLTYLDAAENDISSITTHLPDSLTALNLSNNKLSALPDVLPTGLTSLYVNANQIAVLPAFSDAFLSSLVSLNLSGNNITKISDSLINLTNAKSKIDLSGNPLDDDIILTIRQRYLAQEPHLPSYKLPLLSKEVVYKSMLQQWVQTSPTALEKAVRGTVMGRVMECLVYYKTKLDLSSLNITTLPDELPPQLTHLDISGNQLTTLPDLLPAGLKKLYAEHNLIRVLPTSLPPGLQVMDFSDNKITSLPSWSSAFVSSIEALDVSENQLTSIPLNLLQDSNDSATLIIDVNNFSSAVIDQMRAIVTDSHYHGAFIDIFRQEYIQTYIDSLNRWVNAAADPTEKTVRISLFNELKAVFSHDETDLNLSALNLTFLPERLPPTLTSLDVSHNKLTELPEHLPGGLKSLYASNNRLSKLPDNLSSRLTHLDVDNNKLVTLPDHLPHGLKDLSLRNNLLTRLPLPSDLPTVSWFRADGNRQPLSVAVTVWFAGDPDSVTAQWQSLDSEGNSIFLGDLLVRLLWTKNGKSAGFKSQVAAWLEQLLADPTLQESAFAQASEAFDTCDDKALLVFNNLQDESLTQVITTGQLDTRLPDLLSVAREIFRRQALDRIAKAKADLLFPAGNTENPEHVEVYLGYQVALKQQLGLTHTIDDMIYFTSSSLTQADLDAAEAEVKSQESTQFSSWLAHWAPWQGVLERYDADAFDDARENLIEKLDETAPRENIEYLRRGYTGSNDATITPAVKKEVESLVEQQFYEECYGPIATQLFKDAGLVHLLDDPWVAHGANGGGIPTIQRLLDLNNLLQSGLHNLADIVSQQQTDGIHVLFAPQSFLLGDVAERGICDSLSEAWLYTLAHEDNGALRTTLLDNVFLRSQYLIADAAAAGRVTGTLSDDTRAFLDTLAGLDTTGSRTIQSLSEVVHQLASASGDIYLSLYTGNHALALARRTQGNTTAFWLYDPNFGEVMLPVSGAQDDGSALTSLINNVLGMKTGDGQETLADYYQTERQNGDYSFTVRTVNTASLPTRPDLQALQAQLQKAVIPDVPPTATAGEVLSPELESLRQTTPEIINTLGLREWKDAVSEDMRSLLAEMLQKMSADLSATKTTLEITGYDVVSREGGKFSLEITYQNAGHEIKTVEIDNLAEKLQYSQSLYPEDSEPVVSGPAEIAGDISHGINLFFVLNGLFDLLKPGNLNDKVAHAPLALSGLLMTAEIPDKIANAIGQKLNISTMLAKEDGSFIGGGTKALFRSIGETTGGLFGLGKTASGQLGEFMGDMPILGSLFNVSLLYSDILTLQNAAAQDKPYYEAMLGLDATATGLSTLAPFTGPAMPFFEAGAQVLQFGHIIADLFYTPAAESALSDALTAHAPPEGGSFAIADLSSSRPELNVLSTPGLLYDKPHPVLRGISGVLEDISDITLSRFGNYIRYANYEYFRLINDYGKALVLDGQDIDNINQLVRENYRDFHSVPAAGADDPGANDKVIQYLRTLFSSCLGVAPSTGEGKIQGLPVSDKHDVLTLTQPLRNTLNFNLTDASGYLIPTAGDIGDIVITLTETEGYDISYMQSAVHDSYTSNSEEPSGNHIAGPQSFTRQHVTTGMVNDIIMGVGAPLTVSWQFRDVADSGTYALHAWSGDMPHDVITSPQTWLNANDVDGSPQYQFVPYVQAFQANGNSHGNRFYSVYADPVNRYDYTVNGGAGDDILFLSQYGNYTFNGGGGTNSVVASATKRPDADYSVFDLQPAGSPVSTEKYSLHKNFSLTMTNVASIQGSDNNEIFHGDDRSNIIVTGGGHNVVWLSGGGDRYGVSGSVIFYGQTGRKADAPRDIVMLSKVNLADLTLGDKQLSGAGVQVTTDDLASEQLIFVTEDKHTVYVAGGGWVTVLTVPDLLQVPSLHVALYDSARKLSVPGLERVLLPVSPFPRTVNLCDGASGLQTIMQYDAGGNVTQAILSLSESFTALTVDNMKTYTRLVAGIDKVQWRTRDNVLFRLVKQTAADGSARQVLLIDHIDAPAGAVQPDLTLPAGNALGVDMVVADVTGLVQSGPSQDNGLWIGANPAGSILLRYQSTQTLTAGALSSLKWINEDDKRFTLQLPDSRKISTGNASSLKQFVLSLGDAQGNGLEGDFSDGVLTQAVLTLKQTFDSGLDTAGLLAQSDALSAAGGSLVVKTQDGVTFRFVRQAGTDGKPQLTVVVDAVDAAAYKAAHAGDSTPPFGAGALPGVDVLVADITALVQSSRIDEGGGVLLGTSMVVQKTVYHYRTAQVMTAQRLSALQWRDSGPDSWILELQDGNGVYLFNADVNRMTLVISDAKGSEWQINYAAAPYATPRMVQAVDAKGLSPFAVMQGVLTAVYGGDAAQKTGVSIDLSQPVQAGGESLAGVMQVSGSAYADVLSGNGGSVVLSGGGGNDVLSGGGVALLVGGAGADTYIVKPGDNVVISAQGNGTAADTLVFAEQDTGALSFALKDDDLVVSSADRVVVLKNWAKGDNHYRLSGSDGEQDEAAFRSLVKDSLALPGLLKALSAQYTALAQRNAAGAQVVTQVPLDAGRNGR